MTAQPNPMRVLPEWEVAPGIVSLGYWGYRQADLKDEIFRAEGNRYGRRCNPELAEQLYGLLFQLDEMYIAAQGRPEGQWRGMGLSSNHMMVKFRVHGHELYFQYSDGNVYVGTEVNPHYW